MLTALSPGEQVIKIVRDELVETLGKDTAKLKFASQPPTVMLMAGLQGSGKTTTSGKLAQLAEERRTSAAAGLGGCLSSCGARAVEGGGQAIHAISTKAKLARRTRRRSSVSRKKHGKRPLTAAPTC